MERALYHHQQCQHALYQHHYQHYVLPPLYILRTSFPFLQPCILSLSSFARISMMMMKGCCLLIRDWILQLLLPVRVLMCCCLRVTIAIAIFLSDRVPVVVVAAGVVFRLHLDERWCWWRGVACWPGLCSHLAIAITGPRSTAVCVSRLPLTFPLSDHILVVVVAGAAVPVALGG